MLVQYTDKEFAVLQSVDETTAAIPDPGVKTFTQIILY